MGLSPAPGIPTNSRLPVCGTRRAEAPPTLPTAEGLAEPCTWQSVAEARALFERFLADTSNSPALLQNLRCRAGELSMALGRHLPPIANTRSFINFQTSLGTLSSLDCSTPIAAVTARYALTGSPSGNALSVDFSGGLTRMQDELVKLEQRNTRQTLTQLIDELAGVLVRIAHTPCTALSLARRPEERQREWQGINETAVPLLVQSRTLVGQFDPGAMRVPVSRALQAIDLSERFLRAGQKKGSREKLSSLVSALASLRDSLEEVQATPARKPMKAKLSGPTASPAELEKLRAKRRAFVRF